MSKLLINEYPLLVLPSLATQIGLNEALIVQQLHYWIEKSVIVFEDKKWVYNTIDEWVEQFPFWSKSTIKRTFENLGKIGLVLKEKLSEDKFDKTNYYTIDYNILSTFEYSKNTKKTTSKNESIDELKLSQSMNSQNESIDELKLSQSYIVKSFDRDYSTETTTEILSPKSSLKQKKEEERSFDKSLFLKFIEDTRKVYKGNGDRNWFPTLFDYQDNQIGVNSNGHLYVKGTGETLQPSEAQNLWEYIFKHKEQIVSIEHQIENHRQKIIQGLRSKTLSQGDQAS